MFKHRSYELILKGNIYVLMFFVVFLYFPENMWVFHCHLSFAKYYITPSRYNRVSELPVDSDLVA